MLFGPAIRLHQDFENAVAPQSSQPDRLAPFRPVRDELRGYPREFIRNR